MSWTRVLRPGSNQYARVTVVIVGCGNAVQLGRGPSVWERIAQFKQPVIEPREGHQLNAAMEDFYAKIKAKGHSGAVFFAVCRGKVRNKTSDRIASLRTRAGE